ncbi:MAG: 4-hydroxybenzoate octaprenyltransferase [Hyphomicrobiaceae bacterium hypho_1]
MSQNISRSSIIADALSDNWVDKYAPESLKPYFKLARLDRPAGLWLLLLPCWLGQLLSELEAGHYFPDLYFMFLFAVGAFVMRGAGCTWNDIIDRDYDGRVARTALRPIPSGQVSVKEAFLFAVSLSLIGFLTIIQFNIFTVFLGISSLGLVAAYPFAKRYTYWPQLLLGLTFKWGVLVGWAAVQGELSFAPIVLYVGCVFWTIGYDTIYAHQDRDDDAMLGLKSTAIRFGDNTPRWLLFFYFSALFFWCIAAAVAGAGVFTMLGLSAIMIHFTWQIVTLDITDGAKCLFRFKSNNSVGLIFLIGILFDILLR